MGSTNNHCVITPVTYQESLNTSKESTSLHNYRTPNQIWLHCSKAVFLARKHIKKLNKIMTIKTLKMVMVLKAVIVASSNLAAHRLCQCHLRLARQVVALHITQYFRVCRSALTRSASSCQDCSSVVIVINKKLQYFIQF